MNVLTKQMKQQRLFKIIFILVTVISISLACDEDDESDVKNRVPYFGISAEYFSGTEILN